MHNKNAIKVSPFLCDTGCFHRTDDITNADYQRRLLPFIKFIIYQKPCGCQDALYTPRSLVHDKKMTILSFLLNLDRSHPPAASDMHCRHLPACHIFPRMYRRKSLQYDPQLQHTFFHLSFFQLLSFQKYKNHHLLC